MNITTLVVYSNQPSGASESILEAVSPLIGKVRYQQKVLDIGNKINIGIELKILGSKVMGVIRLQ